MSRNPLQTRLGLCADCRYRREIVSATGSVFQRCERGLTDPAYDKYPRLPVLACRGYEQSRAESDTIIAE